METRKLQTVRGGTYTVSLPKEWATSQGLSPGDLVSFHIQREGALVVQSDEGDDRDPRRIALDIDHADADALERTFRSAYSAGAREISLDAATPFTPEQRRRVDRIVKRLTGLSVVDQSTTHIAVRTLLDTEKVSLRQLLRQLTEVTVSMHRDAVGGVFEDSAERSSAERSSAVELAPRCEQVSRLSALIEWSVARGLVCLDDVAALGYTRPELCDLRTTTRLLTRVAADSEALVDRTAQIDNDANEFNGPAIQSIARTAREAVVDAVGVVIGEGDLETAQRVLTTRDRLHRELDAVEDDALRSTPDAAHLCVVLPRVRRTVDYGGWIAECGLQRCARRNVADAEPETDLATSVARD